MARRRWNPTLHPRDKNGRFTRSATREMKKGDRVAAAAVMAGFKPCRGVTGTRAAGYLTGIRGSNPTPTAGGAVHRYLNEGGFVDVHTALRAGRGSENPDVADLDAAMIELPDDLLVSRRVPASMFGDVPPDQLVGLKVRDAAYSPVSVSTVPGRADDVRMRIAVPAGTRAIVSPDTGELILDRDLEMAVASVDKNSADGWDMHLVVLPKDGAPGRTDDSAGTGNDPAAEPDDDGALRAELTRLLLPELKARARDRGLKPGRRRKSQIVDMIVADERGDGTDTARAEGSSASTALTGDAARAAAPISIAKRPRGRVTRAQRDVLLAYKGPGYESANNRLREHRGDIPDRPEHSILAERIQTTDAALARSPLTANIRVDRGIASGRAVFGDAWDQDLTGAEWTEHGYMSTTTSERMAGYFAGDEQGGGARLRMLVPAGVHAVELSGADDESELLLQRGLRVRVLSDSGPGPGRKLTVEVHAGDRSGEAGADRATGARARAGTGTGRSAGADDDGLPGRTDAATSRAEPVDRNAAAAAVTPPPPLSAGARSIRDVLVDRSREDLVATAEEAGIDPGNSSRDRLAIRVAAVLAGDPDPVGPVSVRTEAADRIADLGEIVRADQATFAARQTLQQSAGYDLHLQWVAGQQRLSGRPQVASRTEMDEAVQTGWTETWRGVVGGNGHTAAAINARLRDGAFEPGRGLYGNGVYTSLRRNTAETYRHREPTLNHPASGADFAADELDGPAELDSMLRIAIDPTARIVDYDTLLAEWNEWRAAADPDAVDAMMFSDIGRFAAARGYDAIRVAGDRHADGGYWPGWEDEDDVPRGADQFVIVNRTVMMIQRAEDEA